MCIKRSQQARRRVYWTDLKPLLPSEATVATLQCLESQVRWLGYLSMQPRTLQYWRSIIKVDLPVLKSSKSLTVVRVLTPCNGSTMTSRVVRNWKILTPTSLLPEPQRFSLSLRILRLSRLHAPIGSRPLLSLLGKLRVLEELIFLAFTIDGTDCVVLPHLKQLHVSFLSTSASCLLVTALLTPNLFRLEITPDEAKDEDNSHITPSIVKTALG